MPMRLNGAVGSTAIPTYYEEVLIHISADVHFKSKVGFTTGMDAQGLVLLGQTGFFENYSVLFEHQSKLFHIVSQWRPSEAIAISGA